MVSYRIRVEGARYIPTYYVVSIPRKGLGRVLAGYKTRSQALKHIKRLKKQKRAQQRAKMR